MPPETIWQSFGVRSESWLQALAEDCFTRSRNSLELRFFNGAENANAAKDGDPVSLFSLAIAPKLQELWSETMSLPQPHYLLFCNTTLNSSQQDASAQRLKSRSGRWHFVLEELDGSIRLEATDAEQAVQEDRLALLSVVRGLEALDQPSKVTLVTTSRYVMRGLRYGLSTWREAEYRWERFGEKQPIRNADLWRRIDGALQFHGVSCRFIGSKNSVAAPLMQSVEQAELPLPSTEPRPEAVASEAVASSTSDLWISRAERRIQELESQLAAWQAQEIAIARRPQTPARARSWREWSRLALGWLGGWRNRFQPNHALMGT